MTERNESMEQKQQKRRMIIVATAITVLLAALGYRLYVIQIRDGAVYEAMARSQQQVALSGWDSRGQILDRNGEPLTGAKLEYVYILRKDRLDEGAEGLIEKLNGRERRTSNQRYRIVTAERYQKETSERLRKDYGAYILQLPQRYEADQTAVYLLGYIRNSDGVGVAGLEKAFDGLLSQGEKKIYGMADAANRILPGYGIAVEAGGPAGAADARSPETAEGDLVTTLDKTLQRQIEAIVKNVTDGRCCAIVTEVESGEILACATAPGFDPMGVEELLKSNDRELLDIALQGQYPPGSVFKIAVAAAALETGVCTADRTFVCDGGEELGDVVIGCTAVEGHGELTMEEAFAQSCNCAFIRMGQMAGAEAILDMAQRLGLGRPVLAELDMDKAGNLPRESETAGAGIGNLSIGQGPLLVTPLQVAQMTQTVANGGVFTGLKLVKWPGGTGLTGSEAVEAFGAGAAHENDEGRNRVMSPETARALLRMMGGAVADGTAQCLSQYDCGGKTGSAEGVLDGRQAVHAWFTGVTPANEPKYAVTVFVEGGGTGGAVAAPVCGEILRVMASRSTDRGQE